MDIFVLLAMLFCHIFDDFFLQSAWLVNGKQKSWWEKNAPDSFYSSDYIVCLVMHGFSWAFMIMLPIAISLSFQVPSSFVIGLAVNTIVHAVIDDLKANRHKLNLIEDQSLHIIQIVITYANLHYLIV